MATAKFAQAFAARLDRIRTSIPGNLGLRPSSLTIRRTH